MAVKTTYWYDEAAADHIVNWFRKYLRHTKGPWVGQPFNLIPWQEKVLRDVWGWKKEITLPNGQKRWVRRYQQVYIEIPKKNGKSEFMAGIALYMLMADGEQVAEVYGAAADHKQAAIVYKVASIMIKKHPALKKRSLIRESTKRIIYPNTNSVYEVLSSDIPTKDGLNASCVVFDELHTQKTPALFNVLTEGSGAARVQPLFIYCTTAGWDKNSVCWNQHDYAQKVNKGIIKDDTFYGVIYAADPTDDITKKETWYKANPSLGITILEDNFEIDFKRAIEQPWKLNNWLRLRLNIWTSAESKWIDYEKWDKGNIQIDMEKIKGKSCWLGMDLSSRTDITALVAVFPDDDGFYDVICKFYIPEENMYKRSLRDKVPYEQWYREGFITATPGDVIDQEFIRHDIMQFGSAHKVEEIDYDPYEATETVTILQNEGFNMVPFRQGDVSMNPAVQALEEDILRSKIRHGGNPVLSWMMDNIIFHTGPTGLRKPDKKRSTEKIDGVVGLLMAHYRASISKNIAGSTYEKNDLKSF